jgi:hypothetical protein
MRKALLLVTFMSFLAAIQLVHVEAQQPNRYKFSVKNNSDFEIYKLHMSTTEINVWGTDYLGNSVLLPGDTFTLKNITAGEYDIKLVDEDGDQCVLRNIQIFKDTSWSISTEWLVKCEFRNR